MIRYDLMRRFVSFLLVRFFQRPAIESSSDSATVGVLDLSSLKTERQIVPTKVIR